MVKFTQKEKEFWDNYLALIEIVQKELTLEVDKERQKVSEELNRKISQMINENLEETKKEGI